MHPIDLSKKRIVISKTTQIGDVVISLPIAAVLKRYAPTCTVIFLAKKSACDIAKMYPYIDEVYDWNEIYSEQEAQTVQNIKALKVDIFIHVNACQIIARLIKKAEILIRIGSAYRWYHWLYCNHLVPISRGTSYNKRQLDLQYLKALGLPHLFSYEALALLYQFNFPPLPSAWCGLLHPHKFNLILHPSLVTAAGSRWPLAYYSKLIEALPETEFQIFVTGVLEDRAYMQPLLESVGSKVIDLVGRMPLSVFFTFIHHCDGLIAGSTGPLHLAAAAGIYALGLYRGEKAYIKRWEPVGKKAQVIAHPACILKITPQEVLQQVNAWRSTLFSMKNEAFTVK